MVAVVVLVGVGIFGVLAAMQVVVVVVHFVVVAVVVLVLHVCLLYTSPRPRDS